MMTTAARFALLAALALALLLPGTILLAQQDNDGADNDNNNGEQAPAANDANGTEEQDAPAEEQVNGEEEAEAPARDEDEAENDEAAEEQEEEPATIQLPELSYPDMFVLEQDFSISLELVVVVDEHEMDRVQRDQTAHARTRVRNVELDDEQRMRKAQFQMLARYLSRSTDGAPSRRTEFPYLQHPYAELDQHGEVRVTIEEGDEETNAPEPVAEVIGEMFHSLRAGFPLLSFLAEEPRVIGDEITLSSEYAAGFFNLDSDGNGDFNVTELAVTPRRVAGSDEAATAVYDLRVMLVGEIAGEMPAELELRGDVRVDLDTGWPRRLALAGPLHIRTEREHAGQTLTLRGDGTAELNVTFEVP